MAVDIRSARPQDHALVASLFTELGNNEPAPAREEFGAVMHKTTLIAEREGRGVGYAFYRPPSDVLHVSQLVTHPEARRTGVARALMGQVVRRAQEARSVVISLNVLATHVSALAFYRSLGFAPAFASRWVDVPWALAEAGLAAARDLAEADDARAERDGDLRPGSLADHRSRPGRYLRIVESAHGQAFGVHDSTTNRVVAFRASDLMHARALLAAFPRHVGERVHLLVENHVELADALTSHGATAGPDLLHMRAVVAPPSPGQAQG